MEKENQKRARIQPTIFILFVVIGLLPMAVGSVILLSGARATYQEVIGGHLSVVAENAQMELNTYFRRTAEKLRTLSLTPEIRTLVYQSNQRGLDRDPQKNLLEWAKDDQSNDLLRSVMENDAARFLREYVLDSNFRDILVTDAFGRIVAATHRGSDYYVADQKWWRFAFREGAGGRYIGDITYDEEAGFYGMDYALPIVDRTSQRAVGVIRAVVDSEEILNLVNSIKVGERGRALLVRGDSMILVGPHATFKDQRRFKYFNAMRNALERGDTAIQIGENDERSFLGFPTFRMKDSLPELDWYLAVAQPRNEALALFRNINTKFFYIVLFTVAVVALMSIFFSWILFKPIIETDPHLEKL